jgi:hypothetical protein
MFCRNCSFNIENPVDNCPRCQTNPIGSYNFCQTCGCANQASDILCGKCGALLSKLAEPARLISTKPKSITALLAILPALVGLNGIHRLYLGRYFSAALMFLTLGGIWIWTIIDVITILRGKMKDKEGKPVTG